LIQSIFIFIKAFDSVPHNQPLVKLWNMGFTGTRWNSYLHNRIQLFIKPFISFTRYPPGKHTGPFTFSSIYQWLTIYYYFLHGPSITTYFLISQSLYSWVFIVSSILCILSMVTLYPSHPAAKTWALSLIILYREGKKAIICKAYKSLGLLRRVFKDSHSSQARKCLYLSLVRSNLLYCSPLWRPYLLKNIIMLERVQRKGNKIHTVRLHL